MTKQARATLTTAPLAAFPGMLLVLSHAHATPPPGPYSPEGELEDVTPSQGRSAHTMNLFSEAADSQSAVDGAPTHIGGWSQANVAVIRVRFTGTPPEWSQRQQPSDEALRRRIFGPDPSSVSAFLAFASNDNFTLGGVEADTTISVPWNSQYAGIEGGQPLVKAVLPLADQQIDFSLADDDSDLDGPGGPRDDGYADVVLLVVEAQSDRCNDPPTVGMPVVTTQQVKWERAPETPFTYGFSTNDPSGHYDQQHLARATRVNDVIILPIANCPEADVKMPDGSIAPAAAGVIAHEILHSLWIPDLYDRTWRGKAQCMTAPMSDPCSFGAGPYCLMAYGLDGASGKPGPSSRYPVLPSAWVRLQLRWTTAQEITTSGEYEIRPVDEGGTVYKIPTSDPREYLLIEWRRPAPDPSAVPWDGSLPGSGLLIWRVDTTVGEMAASAGSAAPLSKTNWPFVNPGTGQNDLPWRSTDSTGHFLVGLIPQTRTWNLDTGSRLKASAQDLYNDPLKAWKFGATKDKRVDGFHDSRPFVLSGVTLPPGTSVTGRFTIQFMDEPTASSTLAISALETQRAAPPSSSALSLLSTSNSAPTALAWDPDTGHITSRKSGSSARAAASKSTHAGTARIGPGPGEALVAHGLAVGDFSMGKPTGRESTSCAEMTENDLHTLSERLAGTTEFENLASEDVDALRCLSHESLMEIGDGVTRTKVEAFWDLSRRVSVHVGERLPALPSEWPKSGQRDLLLARQLDRRGGDDNTPVTASFGAQGQRPSELDGLTLTYDGTTPAAAAEAALKANNPLGKLLDINTSMDCHDDEVGRVHCVPVAAADGQPCRIWGAQEVYFDYSNGSLTRALTTGDPAAPKVDAPTRLDGGVEQARDAVRKLLELTPYSTHSLTDRPILPGVLLQADGQTYTPVWSVDTGIPDAPVVLVDAADFSIRKLVPPEP